MNDVVSKKDLETVLDERFEKHQVAILDAVSAGFEQARNERQALGDRMDKLEASIDHLATTLDEFLKRLTNHEDEFTILKAENAKMKKIIKDKLGIEVSL